MHCNHHGLTFVTLVLVTAAIIIILSTIDFHTGSIWGVSPLINAETRYFTTLLAIIVLFVFMHLQYSRLDAFHMVVGDVSTESSETKLQF